MGGRSNRKTDANATLSRWPVKPRSLHSSASRITCGRGKGRARFFCLEPGLVIVALRTRVNILDSVRLALPRSPESGFAVSIHV